MKKYTVLFAWLVLAICVTYTSIAPENATRPVAGTLSVPVAQEVPTLPASPIHRGISLSGWLDVASPERVTPDGMSEKILQDIKNTGFDYIEIPVNFYGMCGRKSDGVFNSDMLGLLDRTVGQALELKLSVVVTCAIPDEIGNNITAVRSTLIKAWPQVARHFASAPSSVYFCLADPYTNPVSSGTWNSLLPGIIKAVREVDTGRTLIVSPGSRGGAKELLEMPPLKDSNLIYSFAFLDPFLFSLQDMYFLDPAMTEVNGIPFPYDASRMPSPPNVRLPPGIREAWDNYLVEGTSQGLENTLLAVRNFGLKRNAPILGMIADRKIRIPNPDRVARYKVVRELFDRFGMSWSAGSIYGDYGILATGMVGELDRDLDVPLVEALGLKPLPQKNEPANPMTDSLVLYHDGPGKDVFLWDWGNAGSQISYFNPEGSTSGGTSITWGPCKAWDQFFLLFARNLDLKQAVKDGWRLEFLARMSKPETVFSVAFYNPGTWIAGIPWRMSFDLDQRVIPADGQWHKVVIPLNKMVKVGASKGTWIAAKGLSDWTKIELLSFQAGGNGITGDTVFLDEIRISK